MITLEDKRSVKWKEKEGKVSYMKEEGIRRYGPRKDVHVYLRQWTV